MIVGTLVSAVGAFQQKQSESQSYAYSAASARQAAGETSAAGTAASMEENRKTQLALSANTAAAAGAGVNPAFGSPLSNAGKIAKFGTYNQLMAMYDANVQATGLKNEAGGYDFASKQAKAAAPWAAASTLISGGESLYGKYGSDLSGGGSTGLTPLTSGA